MNKPYIEIAIAQTLHHNKRYETFRYCKATFYHFHFSIPLSSNCELLPKSYRFSTSYIVPHLQTVFKVWKHFILHCPTKKKKRSLPLKSIWLHCTNVSLLSLNLSCVRTIVRCMYTISYHSTELLFSQFPCVVY